MRSFATIAAVGIFAHEAMAQTASFNPPITFANVTVGQVQTIGWTVGDGTPVSVFLGNTSWNTAVFENKPATDATFDWTVAVPDGFVAGNYALALVQSGYMDFSPLFSVIIPNGYQPPTQTGSGFTLMSTHPATGTMMPNATMTGDATLISSAATMTAGPATVVTVTVWDPECGCHKTSEMPATAVATGSGVAGTQYTWWDHECGCTKTAMAPAPTTNMGSINYTAPAGGNVPVAPSSAPSAPAAPSQSTFMGAGNRLVGSSVAVLGFIAGAMLA